MLGRRVRAKLRAGSVCGPREEWARASKGWLECTTPLPQEPRRALILTKHAQHVGIIRQAASAEGLTVDALGPGVDKEVDDLPGPLRDYDIVFATARMAIEALAVGCAVVVVDQRGLAGLVTQDVVEPWRQENFGLRLLQRPVDAAKIRGEIQVGSGSARSDGASSACHRR